MGTMARRRQCPRRGTAAATDVASLAGVAAAGPKTPNPWGMKGNPQHQAAVGELVKLASSEFPDRSKYRIRESRSIFVHCRSIVSRMYG